MQHAPEAEPGQGQQKYLTQDRRRLLCDLNRKKAAWGVECLQATPSEQKN
jgi:hypothetical protein